MSPKQNSTDLFFENETFSGGRGMVVSLLDYLPGSHYLPDLFLQARHSCVFFWVKNGKKKEMH